MKKNKKLKRNLKKAVSVVALSAIAATSVFNTTYNNMSEIKASPITGAKVYIGNEYATLSQNGFTTYSSQIDSHIYNKEDSYYEYNGIKRNIAYLLQKNMVNNGENKSILSLTSKDYVYFTLQAKDFLDNDANTWTGIMLSVYDENSSKSIPNQIINIKPSWETLQNNPDIKIPKTIDGVPVVSVGEFGAINTTKTITVPSSVITIQGPLIDKEYEEKPTIIFEDISNIEYIDSGALQYTNVSIDDVNKYFSKKKVEKYPFSFDDNPLSFEKKIENPFASIVQNGIFRNCNITGDGKLVLSGAETIIGESAFENAAGIKSIEISDNVKTLSLNKAAFKNCKNLSVIGFNTNNCSDVVIGEEAFMQTNVMGDCIFNGNTIIGKNAFVNSLYGDTTFSFAKGDVTLCEESLNNTANLTEVKFDKNTTGNITVNARAFLDENGSRKLNSLNFEGTKDVVLENESLSTLINLENLSFNNKGEVHFKENPFCPQTNSYEYKNEKLEKINFNCSSVKSDRSKKNVFPVKDGLGTFYGLSALKSIVAHKNVKSFNIYNIYDYDRYGGSVGINYGYSRFYGAPEKFNTMIFYNPDIELDIFDDIKYREGEAPTYYGFPIVQEYCRNKKMASFRSITNGLMVINKDGFILQYGEELSKDDIKVGFCTSFDDEFYSLDNDDYELEKIKDGSNPDKEGIIEYSAIYGKLKDYNQVVNFSVRMAAKKITGIEVGTRTDMSYIEGTKLTKESLDFKSIKYNNGEIETKDCEKYLKDIKILVNGIENGKLEAGNNEVIVECNNVTATLNIAAEKKQVSEITDIVVMDTGIRYYENNVVTRSALKVSVLYNNGEKEDNYTDFDITRNKLSVGKNNVFVTAGNIIKSINIYAEPLQAVSIKAKYVGEQLTVGDIVKNSDVQVSICYNDSSQNKILESNEYMITKHTIKNGINMVYIVYSEDNSIITEILVEGIEKVTTPTVVPTVMPTTQAAVVTTVPAIIPTVTPTAVAITTPTVPTVAPSIVPTVLPSAIPTVMPTTQAAVVTTMPAIIPTVTPTAVVVTTVPPVGIIGTPTPEVTVKPTVTPTMTPNTTEIIKDSVPMAKPAVTKTKSLLLGAKESIRVSDLKNATYKSNNSKIADANKKGYIVAKKNGTATITVTKKNGTKVAYKVTVKKAPKKVMASFKSKTLKKGKKITLKAKFEKGCYSNKVSFKSSNSKIATVNQKGVITAKKKGTCKITITTYNKKKVTVKITVK